MEPDDLACGGAISKTKGVDFDLRGCRHFIFRRVWKEDCRVLVDGAAECMIEYLTSPNPTPKQVFEVRL